MFTKLLCVHVCFPSQGDKPVKFGKNYYENLCNQYSSSQSMYTKLEATAEEKKEDLPPAALKVFVAKNKTR